MPSIQTPRVTFFFFTLHVKLYEQSKTDNDNKKEVCSNTYLGVSFNVNALQNYKIFHLNRWNWKKKDGQCWFLQCRHFYNDNISTDNICLMNIFERGWLQYNQGEQIKKLIAELDTQHSYQTEKPKTTFKSVWNEGKQNCKNRPEWKIKIVMRTQNKRSNEKSSRMTSFVN